MLLAVDTSRARWWILYAAASAGAVYSHYTCVFALAAQSVWLVWACPESRRRGILANVLAFLMFVPWIPGAINDLRSPTVGILSALSPLSFHQATLSLVHWIVGYPDSPISRIGLDELPGTTALVMLGLAILIALAGLARRRHLHLSEARLSRVNRRLVLVVALALSVPVGDAILSLGGTHVFGERNLAAGIVGAYLLMGLLLVAAGSTVRYVAVALAITAYALGAARMLQARYQRPDIQAAASYIEREGTPGDVVIDETAALSPGPLSPLDTVLHRRMRVFRVGHDERDHPFGLRDPVVAFSTAFSRAINAASGRRIFVVGNKFAANMIPLLWTSDTTRLSSQGVPSTVYHVMATREYPGSPGVRVQLYAVGHPRHG